VDSTTVLALIDRLLRAEPDPRRQLELTLALVLDAAGAERGFLVVLDESGAAHAAVARGIDGPVAAPELEYSRTLARRALRDGAPVAADGAELRKLQTGVDLAGRSVLVAPVGSRAVVYVDRTAGPFDPAAVELVRAFGERARGVVDLAIRARKQETELAVARRALDALRTRHDFGRIVGRSRAILDVLDAVARAAPTREPILLVGESGTGKELLARAIHENSPRAAGPFLPVPCASIPEGLAEAELFGHAKGAFTGAAEERAGLLEAAHGGTAFLDEVDEMPLIVQGKILRVLDAGEFRKVGVPEVARVDVRFVAATNREPAGRLREDLLFRLTVLRIDVPPLRDRLEDVPLLVEHIGARIAAQYGWDRVAVDEDAMEALLRHRYPGNIRELENLLRRACALSGTGQVGLEHLPDELLGVGPPPPTPRTGRDLLRLRKAVAARAAEEVERRFVEDALARAGGNVAHAARDAGVSRAFFYKLLSRLGIVHRP
jgi:DNA-binding NtrC family response regulator